MSTPLRLRFDYSSERYAIGDHPLHCGECLQIKGTDSQWHHVRIEHCSHGWYFIGLTGAIQDFEGCEVRRY